MKIVAFLFMLVLMPTPAVAELISPRPYCAMIKNDTEHYLYAAIRTDFGTTNAGEKKRHESSFRLDAGQQMKACSTGPFYPGYQIELVVKTMIPIFSCKTRLVGTISITSSRDKEGINRIKASCVR